MPLGKFAPGSLPTLAPAPSGDTTGARDYASVQDQLNAAVAGTVIVLQPGTYIVSTPWVPKRGVTIDGGGKYDTIVKMADGANLDAVIISEEWDGGNNSSDAPVTLKNFAIDGNKANNTGGNNGIILMSYWSTVENVQIKNCAGSALMVSATESDASEISNTLVETRISRCDFRSITGNGIWVRDDSNTTQTVTDGFIQDCIFQTIDGNGIQVDSAAGWLISGNHLYGVKKSAIKISRAWETKVVNNYSETWGTSTTAGTYCFIDASAGVVTGTLIIANNNAFHAGGIQTGVIIRGILVTGGSSVTVDVVIQGNVLRGATNVSNATHGIRVTCNAASTVVNLAQSGNLVRGFDTQASTNVNGGTINTSVAV